MKKITFATNPGAGSLEYVKLLIESLKNNLDNKEHEILVFVDRDTDGLVDYLKSEKQNFHDLKIVTHLVKPVISYQRNSSLIVDLAKYDIISYLHSDMVVSKGYDTAVISELEENTILSSTRIEPPLHPESPITFTKDFGLGPQEFDLQKFNEYAETVKSDKSINYFFAPYTFHKETWNKLGGYDTLFRRAREDSDFVQRCLHANVQLKQTYLANVYHFTCVTSRGKDWHNKENKEAQEKLQLQSFADRIEVSRFLRKWGNFNHGESALHKYDADIVISGDENKVKQAAPYIEPFFSRVWVESEDLKKDIIESIGDEHYAANKLLGFSDEDWNESKKFYNQTDYECIFKVGKPQEYNVLFNWNLDSEQFNFLTNETVLAIPYLIRDTEAGDYEAGNCIISIVNKKEVTPNYKVKNPEFDKHLLIIE